ncbi:MAG: hypothetical protein ACE5GX_10065 [Thermoanaerobaculia bacterium]
MALAACGPPVTDVGAGSTAADQANGLVVDDPPATSGAFAPNLATVSGRLAATWLEPVTMAGGGAGHRLCFARLEDGGWSEPVSIAEGSDFFANWADFPELVESGDGTLYAHWLAKTAEDTYAYSVFLARSTDGGASWEPLGKLNADDTPTEHGFVSFVEQPEGARAFWLDGRGMIDGGPMTLRTALVGAGEPVESVVDARVCECCGTDAVMTEEGPLVVYRDRSEEEVRDVFAVRGLGIGWTEPYAVHSDGWKIAGCPVNGPAVDSRGASTATAWFTAAGDTSRVLVAFSGNSGKSFGPARVVEASAEDTLVLGRVDLSMIADGSAWVSWVAQTGDQAEIRLRRVRPDGSMEEPREVALTSPGRASGFPILERVAEDLFIAWVEVGEERSLSRIHVRAL